MDRGDAAPARARVPRRRRDRHALQRPLLRRRRRRRLDGEGLGQGAGAVRLTALPRVAARVRPIRDRRRPDSVSRRKPLRPLSGSRAARLPVRRKRPGAARHVAGQARRHLELSAARTPVHRAHVPRREHGLQLHGEPDRRAAGAGRVRDLPHALERVPRRATAATVRRSRSATTSRRGTAGRTTTRSRASCCARAGCRTFGAQASRSSRTGSTRTRVPPPAQNRT